MCVKRPGALGTANAAWAAVAKKPTPYRTWPDMAAEIRGRASLDRSRLAMAPATAPDWHDLMARIDNDN